MQRHLLLALDHTRDGTPRLARQLDS
jgi:hypothetical protein